MGWFDFLRAGAAPSPRASFQADGPGILVASPQQLEEALRGGNMSAAGECRDARNRHAGGTAFACVRLHRRRRRDDALRHEAALVDGTTRADASDHRLAADPPPPNRWQKPHQFKRMMQAHVLLRGNAYALKVPGVKGPQELDPAPPRPGPGEAARRLDDRI
jgi:hypothetical protein